MSFHTCGPNEAMVISGWPRKNPSYLVGGRVFKLPFIQRLQKISLNLLTISVQSDKIYTSLGVAISVTGIAQVKIESQNDEMLRTACRQFLGMRPNEISSIIMETLEGHQRAIMGTMTVEEIYQDRQKFSQAVFEVASRDLLNMGITVVSYTLQSISDEHEYLTSLGMGRTAEVHRDARIGQAKAQSESGIKQASAEQAKQAAHYQNLIEVAKSERVLLVKKAEYDIQVKTKNADADLAKDLQNAKVGQEIVRANVGVKLIERKKQIELMEQEIQRKEKELEATVKLPANAEKYRLETLAQADKNKAILEAEAKAQAIKVRGDANAYAIDAKAQAEAEAMKKQAEAFDRYKDAAVLDMVLQTLPRVAAEIAAPLASVDKITMVAGPNGEVGAAKITGEVLDIMNKLPETINSLTGLDMQKALNVSSL